MYEISRRVLYSRKIKKSQKIKNDSIDLNIMNWYIQIFFDSLRFVGSFSTLGHCTLLHPHVFQSYIYIISISLGIYISLYISPSFLKRPLLIHESFESPPIYRHPPINHFHTSIHYRIMKFKGFCIQWYEVYFFFYYS